jgi:hypothetical protein
MKPPIDIANENNNVRLVEILEKRGDVSGGKRRRKTIRKGKINKKRKTSKSKKSNKSKRRRL